MGSLGRASSISPEERERRELILTQISVGGFESNITAKKLCDSLEFDAGMIWRCRVKSSWTPPHSNPLFEPVPASAEITDAYDKVVPHAFVQFASPEGAKKAMNLAGRCVLVVGDRVLRATCGIESSSYGFGRRRNIDPFSFPDAGVEIGSLVNPDAFYTAWKGPETGLDFIVDPFDSSCRFVFTKETPFTFKDEKKIALIKCNFKLEFNVRDIIEIRVYNVNFSCVMVLQLASAPFVYYRTADDDIYDTMPGNLLDDEDPWIRTVDFTHGGAIGRCNCYKVTIPRRKKANMERALKYLTECRVQIAHPAPSLSIRLEPDFGAGTQDPFFCLPHIPGIQFPVLFWVNTLLHKGTFSQHQLSEEFFDLLRSQNDSVNIAAMRAMWAYKRAQFDPTKQLKKIQDRLVKNRSSHLQPKPDQLAVSSDTMEVRRLIITPTRAYCLPPETELSNRVLRKYRSVADRFLRVTFMDEGMQPLNSGALNYSVPPIVRDLTNQSFQQKTLVYSRIWNILTHGFHLCGRRYSFLAFSSNQLRDRSAWFFAEDKNTTVEKILKWMGRFSNRIVAKCAARMGQCFSSTYATVDVPADQVDPVYPDVKRNKYVFSDGIGKITPDLALEVAKKLQLDENPPSAYQIRYAGFKGVVAVWLDEKAGTSVGTGTGKRMFLRPSMNKFDSSHMTLEVISWTRFQPGFLNRQIITLLSALGVPDQVFADMQDLMVGDLNKILVDPDAAFKVVTSSCGEQGSMARSMLVAGFRPQNEPHLRNMLACIRSGQMGDLLSKARIFVPKGRWLMGCLDESGVLQYGECFVQISDPSLPKSNPGTGTTGTTGTRVVVGTVAMAKNPCLHPGDVRVLEAVDRPGLRHMVDCLVFPKNGDRPHPNEASGSDLDGDLYFVTWDESLVPPRSWVPMNYSACEVKNQTRKVQREDIIMFFMKNMVNENLGVICNAHVVHADKSEYGALDENCLKLADLAATAVDFPKTGKLVTMPPSLKPKVYPDFMSKDEHLTYKSEKILGKLYRKIKDMSYDEADSSPHHITFDEIPYDSDLEVIGSDDYLSQAWGSKCSYDNQLNGLLSQYRVGSEGELVTGHIYTLPKYNSRKQGELKEKLKTAYSALKKEFRAIFEELSLQPDSDQKSSNEDKAVYYERKASAWYQVTYHPEWVKRAKEMEDLEGGNGNSARLSFAWIAADCLERIKLRRRRERMGFDMSKAVDSLAAQLAEGL
ncbi:hypothetical protein LUZ60_001011 [Juncus effusus]|nr:hypothetical protein LUZ60_001011 [Juncus effusus]